jgi:hypothetical protein
LFSGFLKEVAIFALVQCFSIFRHSRLFIIYIYIHTHTHTCVLCVCVCVIRDVPGLLSTSCWSGTMLGGLSGLESL